MSHDRLFIGRFTALILRSNNIGIVIDEKSVLCSNEIFATHISPWIGRLFDSNIASSSINSLWRPGMKSIFFALHIIVVTMSRIFFEGICRIRNCDSSKTIAIDSVLNSMILRCSQTHTILIFYYYRSPIPRYYYYYGIFIVLTIIHRVSSSIDTFRRGGRRIPVPPIY